MFEGPWDGLNHLLVRRAVFTLNETDLVYCLSGRSSCRNLGTVI
jgi:hypothetical protein